MWINGVRKQSLEHGAATLEVPAGTYTVEVRSNGFAPAQQAGVVVSSGQETSVALKLVVEPIGESGAINGGGSMDVRRIVAWSLIGVGIVGEVVAGVEGARFLSLKGDLNDDRNKVDKNVADICAPSTNPAAADGCSKFNDAKSARTTAVLIGSAGAVALVVGVVLLVTDHTKEGFRGRARRRKDVCTYCRTSRRAPSGEGGGVNVSFTFWRTSSIP